MTKITDAVSKPKIVSILDLDCDLFPITYKGTLYLTDGNDYYYWFEEDGVFGHFDCEALEEDRDMYEDELYMRYDDIKFNVKVNIGIQE